MKLNLNLGKFDFSAVFRKPSSLAILSTLAAVVCWFFIIAVTSDERTVEIYNVPVAIDVSSGVLNSLGLNVIEGEGEKVTVLVQGKSIVVGGLTAQDIPLRADLSGISGPARGRELQIRADVNSSDYKILSITPPTIRVTFDRLMDKEIPITLDANGISVPEEGYMLGDVAISPNTVTVIGPEVELNRIARAVVRTNLREPLTQSQIIASGVELYDEEGNLITPTSQNHISTSVSTVDISIPVRRIVELPLKVGFINVPENFPLEDMKYTISNESIIVAAPEDSIRNYYELVVGHIDFSQLDLTENDTLMFDVRLPSGFINIENIENVLVSFDSRNIGTKSFNLRPSNFSVTNIPPAYEVQVLTNALNNVKMVGSQAAINRLLASRIVVEIDLSDSELQTGQYQRPVQVYAPTGGFVWAVGDYSVVISVKEK